MLNWSCIAETLFELNTICCSEKAETMEARVGHLECIRSL